MHCYNNCLWYKLCYYPYRYQSFDTISIPKSVHKIMVDTYRIMIEIYAKIPKNSRCLSLQVFVFTAYTWVLLMGARGLHPSCATSLL